MNTMFLLMAEYGSATVQLSQVCEKYFGLKPSTAEKRAAMGDLPIPTFRVAESQKAPRMIHIKTWLIISTSSCRKVETFLSR